MTDTQITTYSVPEISCGHCKSTIETAVSALADVANVNVDIDARTVTVEGGDDSTIIDAIEEVGFDVARP